MSCCTNCQSGLPCSGNADSRNQSGIGFSRATPMLTGIITTPIIPPAQDSPLASIALPSGGVDTSQGLELTDEDFPQDDLPYGHDRDFGPHIPFVPDDPRVLKYSNDPHFTFLTQAPIGSDSIMETLERYIGYANDAHAAIEDASVRWAKTLARWDKGSPEARDYRAKARKDMATIVAKLGQIANAAAIRGLIFAYWWEDANEATRIGNTDAVHREALQLGYTIGLLEGTVKSAGAFLKAMSVPLDSAWNALADLLHLAVESVAEVSVTIYRIIKEGIKKAGNYFPDPSTIGWGLMAIAGIAVFALLKR